MNFSQFNHYNQHNFQNKYLDIDMCICMYVNWNLRQNQLYELNTF